MNLTLFIQADVISGIINRILTGRPHLLATNSTTYIVIIKNCQLIRQSAPGQFGVKTGMGD